MDEITVTEARARGFSPLTRRQIRDHAKPNTPADTQRAKAEYFEREQRIISVARQKELDSHVAAAFFAARDLIRAAVKAGADLSSGGVVVARLSPENYSRLYGLVRTAGIANCQRLETIDLALSDSTVPATVPRIAITDPRILAKRAMETNDHTGSVIDAAPGHIRRIVIVPAL